MSRALTLAALVGAALPLVASARSVRPYQPDLLVKALAWSPDGSALQVMNLQSRRLILDPTRGAWDYLAPLPETGPVFLFGEVQLAPESGMAVALRSDKELIRWSSANLPRPEDMLGAQVLHRYSRKARALAIDARGQTIAVLTGDGRVDIFRGRSRSAGPALVELAEGARTPSGKWPTTVAVSPGAHSIAVGFETGAVHLQDSTHPAPVGDGSPVTALAFDPDGTRLAVARGSEVTLYHLAENLIGGASLVKRRSWQAPEPVQGLRLTRGGARAVHLLGPPAPYDPAQVPLWIADLEGEAPPTGRWLGADKGQVRALAISPDGSRIVTNATYHDLAVFDLETGMELVRFPQNHTAQGPAPEVTAPSGWLGK